jgi:hypothetical protein
MSAPLPLTYAGEGEFSTPRGWKARADAVYVIGQTYLFEPVQPRNMAAHSGYFARLQEAWNSLPEALAEEFPSVEALRHRALIKTGYAVLTEFLAASSAHAAQAAAAFTAADPYALVVIEDRAVRIWRAASQKVKRGDNGGMDAATFEASIDAVERWVADLIECSLEELRRAA